jgi:hypothetical protein
MSLFGPNSQGRKVRFKAGDNLSFKLLSLVLATLGWVLAHGEQTYHETVVVPVDYLQPEALVLLNDTALPEQVVIQVTGSRAAIKGLQSQFREGSVQYLVDLEEAEPGRTVHSFRRPPLGMSNLITMQTVSPAEVEFHFDELSTRTLPVQLTVRGDLPSGYVETSRAIEPSFVTLMGARGELAQLRTVPTVPLRLSDRRASVDQALALDLSGLHMHPDSVTSVKVTLEVSERTGEATVVDVPVVFGDGRRFTMEPATCEVILFGPLPVLAELDSGSLRAEVVGQLDGERVGRPGSVDLGWEPLASDNGKPGVLIRVAHPRAGEVVVKGVQPRRFKVLQVVDEEAAEPSPGSD